MGDQPVTYLICSKCEDVSDANVLPGSIKVVCGVCGAECWASNASRISSGDDRQVVCIDCAVSQLTESNTDAYGLKLPTDPESAGTNADIEKALKRRKRGKH